MVQKTSFAQQIEKLRQEINQYNYHYFVLDEPIISDAEYDELLQLGLAPNWKENITFLPVDFASKAIVGISLKHPENSAVYHLDHPHGIMWTDLIAWLQNYGYSITLCSHQKWRDALTSITPDNALYPFLPQYLAEEEPPQTPSTNIEHAASVLQGIGLNFPEINDSLLHIYFNYLCNIEFLPTPAVQRELLSV